MEETILLTNNEIISPIQDEKEKIKIKELKNRILNQFTSTELETLSYNNGLDTTIERFLIARDYDIEKSYKMFILSMKWRKENNVSTILSKDILLKIPIRKYLPQGFHGTDRLGHPLWIERPGFMQINDIHKENITVDHVIEHHIQTMEYHQQIMLPIQTNNLEKYINKITVIHDLSGLGRHNLHKIVFQYIQKCSNVDQDNYPETVHQIFIVNAPFIFTASWKIIQGFLNAKTLSKIHFLDKNYQTELFKYIDPKTIPVFLGGECECFSDKPHGGCITSSDFHDTLFFNELDTHILNNIKNS